MRVPAAAASAACARYCRASGDCGVHVLRRGLPRRRVGEVRARRHRATRTLSWGGSVARPDFAPFSRRHAAAAAVDRKYIFFISFRKFRPGRVRTRRSSAGPARVSRPFGRARRRSVGQVGAHVMMRCGDRPAGDLAGPGAGFSAEPPKINVCQNICMKNFSGSSRRERLDILSRFFFISRERSNVFTLPAAISPPSRLRPRDRARTNQTNQSGSTCVKNVRHCMWYLSVYTFVESARLQRVEYAIECRAPHLKSTP